jgi:hypothetical protein
MVLDAVLLRTERLRSHRPVRHDCGLRWSRRCRCTYPALILVNRLTIEGFIVSEHMEVWPEALKPNSASWSPPAS